MTVLAWIARVLAGLIVFGVLVADAYGAAVILIVMWGAIEIAAAQARKPAKPVGAIVDGPSAPGAIQATALPAGIEGRLRGLKTMLANMATYARQLEPSAGLARELEQLESELKRAGRQVVELRQELAAEALRPAEPAKPKTAPPLRPKPARVPPTTAAAPPPPPPVAPAPPGPSISERLEGMGPRLFAWVGGAVMLLGVVFLFAFATHRGWIGPELRLVMGGIASTATLLVGLWIRRRHGALYTALAAVGVGLAGLYTTILAAAALYDFLPPLAALLCASVVAAAGTAIALAWRAEMVAGLALVGAMLLPVASLLQGERSLLGLGFVAVLMAAASVVALRARWLVLLCTAASVSAAQLAVFVADSGPGARGHVTLLVLAVAFWAIYAGTGIAHQLLLRTSRLDWLTPSFVLTPGVLLALAGSQLLAQSTSEGFFLLGLTAAYALLGAALMLRRDQRDLATLLIGAASVVAVFGFAELLSGGSLTVVWAAEAVVLAWLARATAEPRFRLAAAGYLVLAVGHALAFEAQPRVLFEAATGLGLAAATVAAVAAASLGVALLLPARAGALGPYPRSAALCASGVLSLHALSLAILELAPSLEAGHVALAATWSAIGLGLTLIGLRKGWLSIELGGLSLLLVTVVEVVFFDATHLTGGNAAASFWVVAASCLLAGHAVQLGRREGPVIEAFAAALVSVGLATAAIVRLLSGDAEAIGLLCLAAIYGGFSAASFRYRLRDLSTLDWIMALTLATAAFAELTSGLALVAIGAAGAAVLAWLSARAKEQRLLVGSSSVLALTLAYALDALAPPPDLFQESTDVGIGAAAIALCAASALVFARYAVRQAFWAPAALALYALSLAIVYVAPNLEVAHIAMAGAWSAIGLGLVLLGLRRRWQSIEWAGLGLLGLTVVEVLAFDRLKLSTGEAAASFWIAAAAAVLAGHAVQLARPERTSPEGIGATLVSFALATAALVRLLSGDAEGIALLCLAAVYGAFAAGSFVRRLRDLSTVDWTLSLMLATAGFAQLTSGLALVAIGAAGAAGLAWLASWAKEQRLLAGSAAVLSLTLGYALATLAQPSDLFEASPDVGLGAAAVALCAASSLALAQYGRREVLWASGALFLYALSLAIAAAAPSLEAGHVALAAVWSAIALALTGLGLRRGLRLIEWAGLSLLALTAVEVVAFDATNLSQGQSAVSFWIVAAAALLAGHAEQLTRRDRVSIEAFCATLVSVGLATAGVVRLVSGDAEAVALLWLAAIFAAFAAATFAMRLRDLSTLDWALSLTLATAGFAELTSGLTLVAVGAVAAAALAWLAADVKEPRLLAGSAGILALTLGYTLVEEARPSQLFQASAHPGEAAAAVTLCAASFLVLAWFTPTRERAYAFWTAGVLGLYALSLAILAAADAVGAGSTQDAFQRGQTAVSGAWALVALAFLYIGLRRRQRTFQLLGFAVFGVVLVKIFFYDLPSLSSVTRALSFMAVGALLLTAGYFYQRLAQRPEHPAGDVA